MFSETDDLVIAKRNIARYAFVDRSDLPRNFQWTELVSLLIGTAGALRLFVLGPISSPTVFYSFESNKPSIRS